MKSGQPIKFFLGFARTGRQLSLKTRMGSKVWGNNFKSAPLCGASVKVRRENKNVGDATEQGGLAGCTDIHNAMRKL